MDRTERELRRRKNEPQMNPPSSLVPETMAGRLPIDADKIRQNQGSGLILSAYICVNLRLDLFLTPPPLHRQMLLHHLVGQLGDGALGYDAAAIQDGEVVG